MKEFYLGNLNSMQICNMRRLFFENYYILNAFMYYIFILIYFVSHSMNSLKFIYLKKSFIFWFYLNTFLWINGKKINIHHEMGHWAEIKENFFFMISSRCDIEICFGIKQYNFLVLNGLIAMKICLK